MHTKLTEAQVRAKREKALRDEKIRLESMEDKQLPSQDAIRELSSEIQSLRQQLDDDGIEVSPAYPTPRSSTIDVKSSRPKQETRKGGEINHDPRKILA